jgi:hypothetical protein
VVNESLAEEVRENHMRAEAGVNMLWLNGAIVNARDVNPFAYVCVPTLVPELTVNMIQATKATP